MKLNVGKALSVLLLAATACIAGAAAASASDSEQQTAAHTKQSILQKWDQYSPMAAGFDYMEGSSIYEQQPQLASPYGMGKLKKDYILDGLKAVNFVRYLAGLPDDITADWTMEKQEQAASLVNAVNGALSHAPSKPAGMDQALFDLALKGTGSSNLYAGDDTLYSNVLGYMSDSDTANIDRLGHRRWILNPTMSKTMFGFVRTEERRPYPYSSMYVFDRSRPEKEVGYNYISWPAAGYFPEEVFAPQDAWSVSLNPNKYDNTRTDGISVVVTRKSDGKTWNIGSGDTNKSSRYLNVETSGFGVPFCIIFRPDGIVSFEDDDAFSVKIKGVYDKQGKPASIEWDTTFFRMLPQVKAPSSAVKLTVGGKLKLSASVTGLSAYSLPGSAFAGYVSEDPSIVKVDGDGNLTGIAVGSAQIEVTPYFQESQTIEVNVSKADPDAQVSSWALADYHRAKSSGLIDSQFDGNYQSPINRYQFTAMAVKLCEVVLGAQLESAPSPFEDIDDTAVSKAVKNGLIKGKTPTEFSPDNTITRQEAATLLVRLYDKLGELQGRQSADDGASTSTGSPFADDGKIAGWAKENVYRAVDLELVNGIGGNKFDPLGQLTFEQTYIILVHVFDAFPGA